MLNLTQEICTQPQRSTKLGSSSSVVVPDAHSGILYPCGRGRGGRQDQSGSAGTPLEDKGITLQFNCIWSSLWWIKTNSYH